MAFQGIERPTEAQTVGALHHAEFQANVRYIRDFLEAYAKASKKRGRSGGRRSR